jgi:hypothetical protein
VLHVTNDRVLALQEQEYLRHHKLATSQPGASNRTHGAAVRSRSAGIEKNLYVCTLLSYTVCLTQFNCSHGCRFSATQPMNVAAYAAHLLTHNHADANDDCDVSCNNYQVACMTFGTHCMPFETRAQTDLVQYQRDSADLITESALCMYRKQQSPVSLFSPLLCP